MEEEASSDSLATSEEYELVGPDQPQLSIAGNGSEDQLQSRLKELLAEGGKVSSDLPRVRSFLSRFLRHSDPFLVFLCSRIVFPSLYNPPNLVLFDSCFFFSFLLCTPFCRACTSFFPT